MAYKYFIYSREQLVFKQARESQLGRRFKLGHVIVNGVKKNITDINATGKSSFSDAKIIAEGEADSMKYASPDTY